MKQIIPIAHIAASLMLLGSCGETKAPEQKAPPPVAVSVYQVKAEDATYYDQYPGTVTALNEVEIRPQVSGYVTAIYFKDGQHVSKGMKLYALDQQQYRAAYDQSVANMNVAKANLAKAQQDADRYQELANKDAIARQVLEHAQADLQTAKMQVEASKANVNSVSTNLRYSIIYAPFDGTIGISQVKMGAAVTPGQTVLNTISSDNPVAVDVAVDEKQINRFVQLQQSGGKGDDSTFNIILPDQTVYPYPGRISFIDRAVDPQTGTIKARIVFPNSKNILKPGMSCNLRVRNNSAVQKIIIPYKAVVEQMGEYFVYVINGNKASQRKIKLGNRLAENIIVLEGLEAGETIATEGVQKLKDGATVQVGAANAAPAQK
jgi:RND family efflux transporter MFP subunit